MKLRDMRLKAIGFIKQFPLNIEKRVRDQSANRQTITRFLTSLKYPYSDIPQKNSRPRLSNIDLNRQLVKAPVDKKYISSYRNLPEDIQINTFRKDTHQ
jgi:hypothetical protein